MVRRRDMISVESARELLAKPEPEILTELGEALEAFGIVPLTPNQLIEAANTWLNERREALRQKICHHTTIREIIETERYAEDVPLLIAIVTVLYPEFNMAVSGLVAVWVIRRGLVSFCG
jgi:hypothetical protein